MKMSGDVYSQYASKALMSNGWASPRWLDQIWLVPKGYQTLQKISDSGHELTICHADLTIPAGGRFTAAF